MAGKWDHWAVGHQTTNTPTSNSMWSYLPRFAGYLSIRRVRPGRAAAAIRRTAEPPNRRTARLCRLALLGDGRRDLGVRAGADFRTGAIASCQRDDHGEVRVASDSCSLDACDGDEQRVVFA